MSDQVKYTFTDLQEKALLRMSKAADNGVGVRLSADEVHALSVGVLCNLISDVEYMENDDEKSSDY